jgi:phosphoglycerate dehydrogenase-like enzyme
MKIYTFLASPNLPITYINKMKRLGEYKVIKGKKLKSSEIVKKYPDIEILLAAPSGIEKVNKELLKSLKKLKYISTLTVGTDFVDLEYARKKRIPVSNAKGCNSQSVAEHTWGMILNLTKRISEFDRDIRDRGAYKFNDYKGIEMQGKTLGIVGLGDVGRRVSKIARGFDMRVLGVNKSGIKVDGVELVDENELFKASDVIAVCVPLNDETRNLISEPEIEIMKNNAIIVNCAREAIVNKNAIVKAVVGEKVFGYGVDTEIMVPIAKDDPYLTHPRILVNVHNAFNTFETEEKENEIVYQNVKSYLEGKPVNVVN